MVVLNTQNGIIEPTQLRGKAKQSSIIVADTTMLEQRMQPKLSSVTTLHTFLSTVARVTSHEWHEARGVDMKKVEDMWLD